MDFGQRVNHLRIALGWSVLALASKSGLKPRALEEVEKGKPPSIRERHALARALDVSVEYLETGDGETGLTSRPTYRAVIRQLERLTPQEQDRLLVILSEAIRQALKKRKDPPS